MECQEQRRLSDAYIDALKRQRWITDRLAAIRRSGDATLIRVAEAQEESALDEAYEAWQTMNQHSCSDRCERVEG